MPTETLTSFKIFKKGGIGVNDRLAINGGIPVRTKKWTTYEDGTGPFSNEVGDYVSQVLAGGRLFRYDTRNLQETCTGILEEHISNFFGCKHALALSSGTAALTVALLSLKLPKGFEVACPMFGFPATASAVLLAGGVPKLFAVDKNLSMDLEDLEQRWNNNIKVIIPVHMRGYAQPIDKIMDFARTKGVYVIEDAIPALGCTAGGKLLGTFGQIGCFSTQSDKTINTGEGGFIITDDEEYFKSAILYSGAYESRVNKHICVAEDVEYKYPLYNFRMDELRAAVAIPQVCSLKDKIEKYQYNYHYIASQISDIVRVRESPYSDGVLGESINFFVDESVAMWVSQALKAEGIGARCFGETNNVRTFKQWHFLDEVNSPEFYKLQSVRNTISYLSSTIDIPLFYKFDESDLDDAISAIRKVILSL